MDFPFVIRGTLEGGEADTHLTLLVAQDKMLTGACQNIVYFWEGPLVLLLERL